MKILMLVNWKVEYSDDIPKGKQPPDYYASGIPYWFFRYFREPAQVDVLDIRSVPWLERFEKDKLRFYVIQALRAIPESGKYDLILSHGMQSGVVISLFRRLWKTKAKHIVFDIGSFNSAAESGGALKLMQFASKSIDGLIYHTSSQIDYYKKFFPWVVEKAQFIRFGTDNIFFKDNSEDAAAQKNKYILCAGYAKRDWNTLCSAYEMLIEEGYDNIKLKLIGKEGFPKEDMEKSKMQVETMPYIPVKQLIEEIKGAYFCVVPLESFNYSYGQMTLLQQMSLGKAVIAAKVPSLLDYVTEGNTALFYEPGNAKDLLKQMKHLLTDENLKNKLGKNAEASVKAEYNEQKMAEDIEIFLRQYLRRTS